MDSLTYSIMPFDSRLLRSESSAIISSAGAGKGLKRVFNLTSIDLFKFHNLCNNDFTYSGISLLPSKPMSSILCSGSNHFFMRLESITLLCELLDNFQHL